MSYLYIIISMSVQNYVCTDKHTWTQQQGVLKSTEFPPHTHTQTHTDPLSKEEWNLKDCHYIKLTYIFRLSADEQNKQWKRCDEREGLQLRLLFKLVSVKLVEFLTVPSSLEYSSQTRLYEGQEEGHLHKEEKMDHVIRYNILISYKHWYNHFCYTDASYCSAKKEYFGKIP